MEEERKDKGEGEGKACWLGGLQRRWWWLLVVVLSGRKCGAEGTIYGHGRGRVGEGASILIYRASPQSVRARLAEARLCDPRLLLL